MSFLFSFLPMFINIPVLVAVVLFALTGAAIFYFQGLPALLSDLANPKVWLAMIGAMFLIAFLHAGQVIKQDTQTIATQQQNTTAASGASKVVAHVIKKKQQNTDAVKAVDAAASAAPVGSEEDAVWDEIERQQSKDAAPAPSAHVQPAPATVSP